jgi:hypothetical protein
MMQNNQDIKISFSLHAAGKFPERMLYSLYSAIFLDRKTFLSPEKRPYPGRRLNIRASRFGQVDFTGY